MVQLKKMKALLTILFVSFCTIIIAQTESSSELSPMIPDTGDLGVTVNVTGLISNISINPRQDLRAQNALMLRYVINDHFTFRTGIAPRVMNYRVTSTDSVGKDLVEFDSTARQSSISIRPGLEYHFTGTRRLDPYLALDAEMGLIGGFKAGSNTKVSDTTGTSTFKRTITDDGGFGLGAKLSLGFNYFAAKRLALGLEYGMGIAYTATGGDRQEVLQIDPTSGTASTQRVLSSSRVFDTQVLVDPTVQFTLSYFFSL